jgi:hypothetical protein
MKNIFLISLFVGVLSGFVNALISSSEILLLRLVLPGIVYGIITGFFMDSFKLFTSKKVLNSWILFSFLSWCICVLITVFTFGGAMKYVVSIMFLGFAGSFVLSLFITKNYKVNILLSPYFYVIVIVGCIIPGVLSLLFPTSHFEIFPSIWILFPLWQGIITILFSIWIFELNKGFVNILEPLLQSGTSEQRP